MVKVNNLDTVLGSLGIELTDKERESLAENLPLTGKCCVTEQMSVWMSCATVHVSVSVTCTPG